MTAGFYSDDTGSDALPNPDQGEPPAGLAPPASATPAPSAVDVFWPKLEGWLSTLSEHLNPILVKEARQAMKSKQFLVTFSLLLILGWIYTLLFIVVTLPGVFYSPYGSTMIVGYYLILAIPLLLVVPYASFRSLAAELEDGTFDLLSITTLTARQIVTGKLGSSVLQIIVYYSALAPCIAFTYLLRGIDVVTIALVLIYTFLASLLLSILSLTLSTVTRARHWQVLLSVLLVMALLLFGFFWCMGMFSFLMFGELAYDEPLFWMSMVAILSFYFPVAYLFVLIAAGQVTFASENRSTGVRVMLLVLQMLIVGWTMYFFLAEGFRETMVIGSIWLALLWAVAGPFLIGENAQLSPRARRELPQSLLGRMAFTWFNPGSGTGYVFTVASLLGGVLTLTIMDVAKAMVRGESSFAGLQPWQIPQMFIASVEYLFDRGNWSLFSVALCSYIVLYQGLARLAGLGLRAVRLGGGMLSVFVIYLLLVVMGCIIPIAIQLTFRVLLDQGNQPFEYTLLQLPNWIWTLVGILDNRSSIDEFTVYLLALLAAGVFGLNFFLAAKEVEHVRTTAPTRVLQDELELHPPPKVVKRGPWDEPAGESEVRS